MPRRLGFALVYSWKNVFVVTSAACGLLGLALFVGMDSTSAADKPVAKSKTPSGLPDVLHPADNPHLAEKVELGKQLYFDPRLSADSTVSCASCHDPEKGWSNGEAVATGVGGLKGGRGAPTIINAAYQALQFWDGRAGTLEEQALGPIQNPIEMNMTLPNVVKRLNGIAGYKKQFKAIYGTDVTSDGIAKAIAAFERTVLSGDAPYDRFTAGDAKALTPAAERGRALFFGAAMHLVPQRAQLSDNGFHNIGIGMDKDKPDVGRFAHSKLEGDTGAFKTPTLREIAKTAPYMHDGHLKTLEDVVAYYNKGGTENQYLDEEIFALKLTKEQIADLVTFLKEGLSSSSYPLIKAPKLPE